MSQFLIIFKDFIEEKSINDHVISIFIWFLGEYFKEIEQLFPLNVFVDLIDYLIKEQFLLDSTYSFLLNGLEKIR